MKTPVKIMIIFLLIIAALAAGIYLFMQQKAFGKNPTGKRLERIEKSPNYKNGQFENLSYTAIMSDDASFFGTFISFLNKPKNTEPVVTLPSVKTDLKNLLADKPTIIWFGHSSYLIKVKDLIILVDPVLSGYASPVSFFGKSFKGSDVYNVDDFPSIDILLLSHDHYDHLDYETITKLSPKIKKIYTGLGVGEHLEHWGISPEIITEFDWWEGAKVSDNIELTATPARHFSGRSFTRAKTLWTSFALKINGYNIFIGGDSGYDAHFKAIGDKYGPFDIALLESGQYNKDWPNIHMQPEETATAAFDLKAKVLMPVHWAKFSLALHPWTEPIERVTKSAQEKNLRITIPQIGEVIVLDSIYPQKEWWAELQ